MHIVFGLALDEEPWPQEPAPMQGVYHAGPAGLLQHLEAWLGCGGVQPMDEYLRIEQYRQLLNAFAATNPEVFYAASLVADPFATSASLLELRDELLLAGWDFSEAVGLPPRLRVLAQLEHELRNNKPLSPGMADRVEQILGLLPHRQHPISEISVLEPEHLLPVWCKRIWNALAATGVSIHWRPGFNPIDAQTDLGYFQQVLLQNYGQIAREPQVLRSKHPISGDGSLLLVRARRDTDLAGWIASLLRKNQAFKPLLLIPDRGRLLEYALREEGLPGLGLRSASEARPAMQVLKLAPVFLWNPVDPVRVMEFVSLTIKPLDDGLGIAISEQLAQRPGLQGESWGMAVRQYFEEVAEGRTVPSPPVSVEELRRQYRFWFERRRYDASSNAPKSEAVELYSEIQRWAGEHTDQNPGLLTLKEQAERIVVLLKALPETRLSALELERIVRTVMEPAGVQLSPRDLGHLPYVSRPGAIIDTTQDLVWWNFTQREPDHFFSRWYKPEREWLAVNGVFLEDPTLKNERLLWQRRHPVLAARRRLILVLPDTCDGEEVAPHPLMGDLLAAFSGLDQITLQLNTAHQEGIWHRLFDLPQIETLQSKPLPAPKPFLYLPSGRVLEARERETFSSIESLLYYPYQWVFRYKIKLAKSPILSLSSEDALYGNLAHRIFEQIFAQDATGWSREQLDEWFQLNSTTLLAKEGASLLLYGREPERIAFLNRVKQAAWYLIHLLRDNGWKVSGVEVKLEGQFEGFSLYGRADMMLSRGDECAILDLKWSGLTFRSSQIRNEADIQLALYALLAGSEDQPTHTAFYIMEQKQVLARNNGVFREVKPLLPESDHREIHRRMLRRVQNTYRWRIEQLRKGMIEVRCTHTNEELEDYYGPVMLELLEPMREDARFDDYRVLAGLVE